MAQRTRPRFPKVAKALRRWRKDAGLAVEALTHKICVSRSTYIRWERGDGEPTVSDVIRMEKVHKGLVQALFSPGRG